MLSHLIWWSSIALEGLLLVRGLQTRLASRYPIFFTYLAFVFLFEDLLSLLIAQSSSIYNYMFWSTQLVGILLGCGVVLEIYRIGLARFPGTARMARGALALIFILAAVKGLLAVTLSPDWWRHTDALELERAIRIVQAIAILGFTLVLLVYSIPFSKNLRGILLGYGSYVSVQAITLTFVPHVGLGFWYYALSASYPLALVTWLAHLWSWQESPAAIPDDLSASDYKWAAAATKRRLQTARGELSRVLRP